MQENLPSSSLNVGNGKYLVGQQMVAGADQLKFGSDNAGSLSSTVNARSLGGPIGGPAQTMQAKNNKLADDYAKRFQRMQDRIDSQIKANMVVPDAVKVDKRKLPKGLMPSNKEAENIENLEKKLQEEIDKKNAGLMQGDLDLIPAKDPNQNKDTYSYTRSKRAVEFRIKEQLDQNL